MRKRVKRCSKCGEWKSFSDDFYDLKAMADGKTAACKDCTKKMVSANRAANLERIREYDRNRPNHLQRARESQEAFLKRKERDPEGVREESARNRWKFPERRKARLALGYAIKVGKLERGTSCEKCGTEEGRIHGHHDDYSKPLEVRWLCAKCHGAHHHAMGDLRQT